MPTAFASRHHQNDILEVNSPLERLFEEHGDFVWRCLRRFGVDDRCIDDAFQDVFVVVHRRIASFEGRSSERTWLFGIVRRVASRHRERAQRRRLRTAPLTAGPDEPAVRPFDRLHAAQSIESLLRRLDRDKRTVFVLAEVEQMTAPEIAQALEVPVGTVYSRLRAAWQNLERVAACEQARLRRELAVMREPPPASERRRLWGLVVAGIGQSAPPATAGTAGAVSSWVAWVAVGTMVVAATITVASVARTNGADASPKTESDASGPRLPQSTPDTPSAHAPISGDDAAPPVTDPKKTRIEDASHEDVPDRSPARRPAPKIDDETPPPDHLAEELALIQPARRALRDGRAEDALRLLDRHAERFPNGQLAGERDRSRTQARCALGQLPPQSCPATF